jgi:ARG/rhodanese/phosphatase superfamily protein
MRRSWTILRLAVLLTACFIARPLPAADEGHISGPFVHENLAIYLVHGNSSGGPVPLTLDEALTKKAAKVHETGDVNSLEIENVGDEPIFVQSGDIVKGGQQDRALTASLLLPPRSGRTRVAVFCVEHGRWSGRDGEDTRTFSSAGMALPSREAKIAIKAPAPKASGADTSRRQLEVWKNVAKIQESLSGSLGAPVASPRSQTSLQLALENDALARAEADYLAALQGAGEKDADVVGYAFAVNGKLSTADIYPSNALFRKMWPKLVKSATAEAIAARTATDSEPAPSTDAVGSFLKSAEHGARTDQEVAHGNKLESRDSSRALYFETRPTSPSAPAAAFIHRSYLAK